MRIEVRCRRCGRAFELSRRAIGLGRWGLCPACQDPPPAGASPDPANVIVRRWTTEAA